MLKLNRISSTDEFLLDSMVNHYGKPKGFVGRRIPFEIMYNNERYGHIVANSAFKHIRGRDEYLNVKSADCLNQIIYNGFFFIERINGEYPCRNFVTKVLLAFENIACREWEEEYGDKVMALETLVKPPRIGLCYMRAGWELIGATVGYECKRIKGKEKNYNMKKIWDRSKKVPKLIYIKTIPQI